MTICFSVFDKNGVCVRSGVVPRHVDIYPQAVYEGEVSLLGDFPIKRSTLVDWEVVISPMVDAPVTIGDIKQHASRLLKDTDWIVLRALERGEPIPKKLALARQRIRDASNKLERSGKITHDYKNERLWK